MPEKETVRDREREGERERERDGERERESLPCEWRSSLHHHSTRLIGAIIVPVSNYHGVQSAKLAN